MDLTLIAARIVHVLSGVFWAGAMIFLAAFLNPALGSVGPAAGKVMSAVEKRGFMRIAPIIALLSILSGFWLYWRASRLDPAFAASRPGMAYGAGAVLALVAFAVGLLVTRPSMMKAAHLAEAATRAEGAERETMLANSQVLRDRGGRGGTIIAWLLIFAVIAMAVGRYV